MQIRLATEKEYEECCKLARKDKFVKDFPSTTYRWGWKTNLYVLIVKNDLKGFIQFNLCKRLPKASLYYVYTKEENRGKGYGKVLFNFYLQQAKRYGKTIFYWRVCKKNVGALKFYERNGFQPTEEKEKDYIFMNKKEEGNEDKSRSLEKFFK